MPARVARPHGRSERRWELERAANCQTLKELAETLPPPPFPRVHKSFIVSLDKIRMVDGSPIYLHDKEIPVGETYREQLYRLIREQ